MKAIRFLSLIFSKICLKNSNFCPILRPIFRAEKNLRIVLKLVKALIGLTLWPISHQNRSLCLIGESVSFKSQEKKWPLDAKIRSKFFCLHLPPGKSHSVSTHTKVVCLLFAPREFGCTVHCCSNLIRAKGQG